MQVEPGAQVVARLLVAPGSLPADAELGARIEVPVTRAIVSYWRRARLDELTGEYVATLDAPPAAGEYNLVWRTGDPEPPAYETFIPLIAA